MRAGTIRYIKAPEAPGTPDVGRTVGDATGRTGREPAGPAGSGVARQGRHLERARALSPGPAA